MSFGMQEGISVESIKSNVGMYGDVRLITARWDHILSYHDALVM